MKRFSGQIKGRKSGFTLAELLVSAAILVLVFTGALITYFQCLELSEMSENTSKAVTNVKTRMAAVQNTNFVNIQANFDDVAFQFDGWGRGVSYVTAINANLLQVKVVYCWRQKRGKVVGEDLNLSGTLDDAGEDVNGNGEIDSPVSATTFIFNR